MSARSPSPRRSGRKRRRNKKYESDTFDALNEILGSPEPEQQEFAVSETMQESENDDFRFIGEGSEIEVSTEDADAVDDDVSDANSTSEIQIEHPLEQGTKASRGLTSSLESKPLNAKPRLTGRVVTEDELHSRGVRYAFRHTAKDLTLAYSFGGTEEEVLPLLRARDKWFGEYTIPSRRVNAHGTGGMGYSFYLSDGARSMESQQGWDWLFEHGGRLAFHEAQKFEYLEPKEATLYLPQMALPRPFLAGAHLRQQLFTLGTGQAMPLDLAWSPADNGKINTAESSVGVSSRAGWLINPGDAVNCLGWVPNQNGPLQCLAIATISKDWPLSLPSPRGNHIPSLQNIAPAFAPAPLTPASIQLWEINGLTERGDVASIDTRTAPMLRLVICSDWGNVKQIQWCPSLREPGCGRNVGEMRYLGMLAVIYGDGKIRVLDVSCPNASETSTQYIKISKVAFESCPPNTVCTCITWLSATRIAAGCANGFVAIWDICEHFLNPNRPENAFPTFYEPIHNSYILAVTSCQPSRPHLLMTSSVEGHIRLTSLHDPRSDNVTSTRFRAGTQALVWQDHTQHALFADDAKNVRALNVRKIYQSLTVAIQDAFVLSIATSPVHPCVLVGGADGVVTAFNPIRKILASKTRQSNFRQVWFKHEWRRGRYTNDGHDNLDSSNSHIEHLDTQRNVPNDATDCTNDDDIDESKTDANTIHNDNANAKTRADNHAPHTVQYHPGTSDMEPSTTTQQPDQASTQTPPPHPKQSLDHPTGLSRFTTGFAIENVKDPTKDTNPDGPAATAAAAGPGPGPGIMTATIHEEETGVRCLSWNPNLHVGGWAAAGLRSGFVWVEDLAWDRAGEAVG